MIRNISILVGRFHRHSYARTITRNHIDYFPRPTTIPT